MLANATVLLFKRPELALCIDGTKFAKEDVLFSAITAFYTIFRYIMHYEYGN